jgi:hypothetical protein
MQTTDIETIKHALAVNRGHFPEQALRAAIEQREAITPILLAALEAAAARNIRSAAYIERGECRSSSAKGITPDAAGADSGQ